MACGFRWPEPIELPLALLDHVIQADREQRQERRNDGIGMVNQRKAMAVVDLGQP